MSRNESSKPERVTASVASTEVRSVTTTKSTASSVGSVSGAGAPAHLPRPLPARASSPPSTRFPPRPSSSSAAYSELHIQPATRTSVVTTTTTTTIHFDPILIPRSKPIRASHSSFSHHPRARTTSNASTSYAQPPTPTSSLSNFIQQEEQRAREFNARSSGPLRLDPKLYPLSQAAWPGSLKKFKLGLGSLDGTFFENGEDRIKHEREQQEREAEVVAGGGDIFTSADKGKGREIISSYTMVSPAHGISGPAGSRYPSSLSYAPHAREPRSTGAAGRRRPSRRQRTSSSNNFGSDGVLEGNEDEDEETQRGVSPSNVGDHLSHRPRMSLDSDDGMTPRLPSPGPPRKRARALSHDANAAVVAEEQARRETAPLTPAALMGASAGAALPSPNQSPPSPVPTFLGGETECREGEPDGEEDGDQFEEDTSFDLGPSAALSGLMSLPDFIDTFDQLEPSLQAYLIFSLLKRSSIPVLQTINNIIAPSLRRDFLTDLPPELSVQILGYLDAKTLCRASVVCKGWRRLVDSEWRVWKERLVADELWIGDGSEERDAKEIVGGSKENLFFKRWNAGVWNDTPMPGRWDGKESEESMHIDGISSPSPRRSSTYVKLASPSSSREASPFPVHGHYVHPFKTLYRRRFVTRRNWAEREPQRISFPCHANNVVTCLQFDKDKIVSASDDHSINVFNTRTGLPRGAPLKGHEGGVWALQYIGNILVSGSTDRTVRIWDLDTGKCTHVFVGHTSTVRCLQIVEPENINPDPNGDPIWEPPYPLIVTGSRDWSLRVWRLPGPNQDEYHPTVPMSPTEENTDPTENPFHLRHLAGHRHAVRALAAHGRTLISGSYDCQVRIWDMLTGECKHRMTGHAQKVYSVVYDHRRAQCASGSMDGTVKVWSTETGNLLHSLEGHTSLVGLLGLSHRNLVSAAADSTLRIWDPVTGQMRFSLAAHSGAITCFQHDEYKVISGSDGTLKMWDVRDGTFTRDLLTGLTGVWQVSFDQRFCVAAMQRNGHTEFEILDFGPLDDEQDGEANDDAQGLIKVEEEEDQLNHLFPIAMDTDTTGANASSTFTDVATIDTPRNPPPPFLQPGEFPRASPSLGRGGVAALAPHAHASASSPSAGNGATGSTLRVIRRAAGSRALHPPPPAISTSATGLRARPTIPHGAQADPATPPRIPPRRIQATGVSLATAVADGEASSLRDQEQEQDARQDEAGMDIENSVGTETVGREGEEA